jgi:transcriptional regulator with XRE-family HTH domain
VRFVVAGFDFTARRAKTRAAGEARQKWGRLVGDERSANALDKRLGERVRARRLEIGMSQERLAELLGVTFQQVQKYEKGANRIAASRLYDISIALDIAIVTFFEGIDNRRRKAGSGASYQSAISTPGATELVNTYASITDAKVRKRVVELVKAMRDSA